MYSKNFEEDNTYFKELKSDTMGVSKNSLNQHQNFFIKKRLTYTHLSDVDG